jgi:low temperature requirement protein LtrA
MTRSRAEELIRQPDQPPRATFKDLFFDLVFVVGFTGVTGLLVADATVHRRTFFSGAGQTLLLILALLMVWFVTVWITELYNTRRPEVQVVVSGATFGGLLMAIELPQAFGNRGLAFAGAYVAIHLGRGLVLIPAMRGHEAQRRGEGVLLWFTVSAIPWIVGAIMSDGLRAGLWTLAIAIDYTGAMRLWPAPWGARPQWPVTAEYLSERYQQFFMIAFGTLLLIAGTTYSAKYLGDYGGHTAALLVSIATTMLLWRTYLYRVGEQLPAAISAPPDPGRTVRRAILAHLLMVVGILGIAAGQGLVIEHPLGQTDSVWLAFIIGGPALFIVGRTSFEHTVFARTSKQWLIGLLVLVGLAPVVRFVPPLAVATIAMAVLLCIAVADAVLSRRHPPNLPSVPAGGPS